ncbi:hypothetical protein E4H12_09750 [Candidatus Thorarchaeota archaeon]|nr:MAG: hypothetical protein E4H12_09750 [Candidatus Thorarchaeota archaeon]
MEKTIEGKIISKQLGFFGKKQIVYGYIGIEKSDGQQIEVKIDSYTWYETLEIGSHVFVELNNLGTTEILVARRIDVNQEPFVINKGEAKIIA